MNLFQTLAARAGTALVRFSGNPPAGLPNASSNVLPAVQAAGDAAKVADANSDAVVKSTVSLIGQPPAPITRSGRTVREVGWERHPVVNACARVIAYLAGAIRFEVYRRNDAGEETPVPRSKAQALLDRPAYRVADIRLRMTTVLHFILYGNAFWLLIRGRGPASPPTSIYMIPPEDMQYVYTNCLGYPLFYVWRDRFGAQHVTSAEDIVHHRDLVADGKPFGFPRAASALLDIYSDTEASNYVRQVVTNDGTPTAAVITEGLVTQEQLSAAEERFHEKMVRRGQRGRVPFVAGIKDIKAIGFNLRELEFPELRQVSREGICAAIGVDPRIIALASASNDAGLSGEQYREARQKLVLHTVEPIMRILCAEQDLWLLSEFGGDEYVRPSATDLANIMEDETATSTRIVAEWNAGLRSFPESRRAIGLADEPGPEEVVKVEGVLMPYAIAVTDEEDLEAEAANAAAAAAGVAKEKEEDDDPPAPKKKEEEKSAPLTDEVRAATLERGRVLTRGVMLSPSQRSLLWSQFDERARSEEAEYRRAARLIFEDERGSIAKVFARAADAYAAAVASSARATPPSKPSPLELEDRYIREAWRRVRAEYKPGGVYHQRWLDRYRTLIGKTYAVAGTEMGGRLGFDFNLTDKAVQDAIAARASQLAGFVSETTATHVNGAIRAARKAGVGIGETARLIDRTVFGSTARSRSVRIARTETVGALNQGEYDTAVAAGVSRSKEWLTQGDDRVRDEEPGDGNHVILDGVRVNLSESFSNRCHHPGDRNHGAPATETINCRCTLLYYDEAV